MNGFDNETLKEVWDLIKFCFIILIIAAAIVGFVLLNQVYPQTFIIFMVGLVVFLVVVAVLVLAGFKAEKAEQGRRFV